MEQYLRLPFSAEVERARPSANVRLTAQALASRVVALGGPVPGFNEASQGTVAAAIPQGMQAVALAMHAFLEGAPAGLTVERRGSRRLVVCMLHQAELYRLTRGRH